MPSFLRNTRISFILNSAFFSLLFLLTIFNLIDYDFWFHIKAGQIISETGGFLRQDIFTFTANGREWIYHEWLFGVLAYKVYSSFGAGGIIIGKAAVLTVAFLVIYRCMRIRGVNQYIASFILLMAVLAARFRLTERAHIFKYLFVVFFIYLLDLYRLKNKNRLWLLPVIELFWVNIHGSFILGPILIAVYILSEAVNKERENGRISVLTTILMITSLTTLINPYGAKIITFSLGFSDKAVLAVIGEWRSTQLTKFYGAFGLLFIMGAASFLLRYRRYRRNEAVNILLFCLFANLSLKAIRFTALFSLAAAPVIAENLQHLSPIFNAKKKQWIIGILSIATSVYLFIYEINRNPILFFGLGQGPTIPVHAVSFLKQLQISGNMYNFQGFGGYLTWRFYPEKKIFVDGRVEVYDKDFQDAFIISPSPLNWRNAVYRYDINYAIVSYVKSKEDRIADWISKDPNWILIYWDYVAKIYIMNLPLNKSIIDHYGHKIFTDPFNFDVESLKEAIAKRQASQLESELLTDIKANQENTLARYWLGMLYYKVGKKEGALKIWKEAVEIKPDAAIYNAIGNVLQEKAVHQDAILYYLKAIETNKRFAVAYLNLGKSYEILNQKQKAIEAYEKFIKYAGPEYFDMVKKLKNSHICGSINAPAYN